MHHINVWEQGTLLIEGMDAMQPCTVRFLDQAEVNAEHDLEIRTAVLEGVPTGGGGSQEWSGILISGPESRLIMEGTLVKDISCDPVWQGTGIHLYEASNTENRIDNTRIARTNKPE